MAASLDEEFKNSVEKVKSLKSRPSDSELLQLYAFYKQATEGDAAGKRPGLLDIKGRKKFDAWSEKKGQSKETATANYIKLVTDLSQRY